MSDASKTYFDQFPLTYVNLNIDEETKKIPTADFIQATKAIVGLFGEFYDALQRAMLTGSIRPARLGRLLAGAERFRG